MTKPKHIETVEEVTAASEEALAESGIESAKDIGRAITTDEELTLEMMASQMRILNQQFEFVLEQFTNLSNEVQRIKDKLGGF